MRLFIGLKNRQKKMLTWFSVEVIFKIFEFSFNLDQSQACISNRLKVTACQSWSLFEHMTKHKIIKKKMFIIYIYIFIFYILQNGLKSSHDHL